MSLCTVKRLKANVTVTLTVLFRLSGVGSRGQQPKQGSPDFPLPSHFVQLLPGDPEAFPGQPRDSLSSVAWVFPGVSYRWDVP